MRTIIIYLFYIVFFSINVYSQSQWEGTGGAYKNPARGPLTMEEGGYVKPTCDDEKDKALGINCGFITEAINNTLANSSIFSEGDDYVVGTSKTNISKDIKTGTWHPEASAFGYSDYVDMTIDEKLSDRLFLRTITITHPLTKETVIYMLFSLGMISQLLREAILEKIKQNIDPNFKDSNLMIAASHNHTAPGGHLPQMAYSTADLGIRPELVDSHSTYALMSIKEALTNARIMKIGYNSHATSYESPISFSRNSWNSYNKNPEMKNKENLSRHTSYKIGDRKMEQLSFIRNGKLHSLISWYASHPNRAFFAKGKYIGPNGKEYTSDIQSGAIREIASEIIENGIEGVALFPQRGAGDIDAYSYALTGLQKDGKTDLSYFKDYPNDAKYILTKYHFKWFDTHPNGSIEDFLNSNDYTEVRGYYEGSREAKALSWEAIRGIENGPMNMVKGQFDSEIAYINLAESHIPLHRGGYARTLSPTDYYLNDYVYKPGVSFMFKTISAIGDLIFMWLPANLRPFNGFIRPVTESILDKIIQFFIPSTKIVRGTEPSFGLFWLLSNSGTTDATATRAIAGTVDFFQDMKFFYHVFTGTPKHYYNFINNQAGKDIAVAAGKGHYYKFLINFIDLNKISDTGGRFVSALIGQGGTQAATVTALVQNGNEGCFNVETGLARTTQLSILKLGNVVIGGASAEVGSTTARRIENTIQYFLKNTYPEVTTYILNDYVNDYVGYMFTPEEYATQVSAIRFGSDGMINQTGNVLHGKWSGEIYRYGFEKLALIMRKRKGSTARSLALSNEEYFSKPDDYYRTNKRWYELVSNKHRNYRNMEGSYDHTPNIEDSTAQVTGEVFRDLIVETTKFIFKTIVNTFVNFFKFLINPFNIFGKW